MKVEDLLKYHGVRLQPSSRDASELGFLPERLSRCGYDGLGVRETLGVADVPNILIDEMLGYLRRCEREGSARSLMTELWLLCRKVEAARVEALLGAVETETLVRRQVLRRLGHLIEARVDLYPCEGAWVFTDRMFALTRFSGHVYELGKDSHALARVTPRQEVESTLDLCTGSGIHAILAARHSARCLGVDLNPRALDYSRVNAAMNGVGERCRFVAGDLYQAVGEETFDLVVSNPPWVPTPDEKMEIYRTGGETGEEVTQRIVEGLPLHLRPGGTLSLFTLYPIMRGDDYLQRVRSWLPGSGWGVAVLPFAEIAADAFARLHIASTPDPVAFEREFVRWMQSYERLGIEKIGMGNVFVRRLEDGAAGWGVQRPMLLPLKQMGPRVGRWLDHLERVHREGVLEATADLVLDEAVEHLWIDARSGEGCAEFDDPAWSLPARLSRRQAQVATAVSRMSVGTGSTLPRRALDHAPSEPLGLPRVEPDAPPLLPCCVVEGGEGAAGCSTGATGGGVTLADLVRACAADGLDEAADRERVREDLRDLVIRGVLGFSRETPRQ